MADAPTAGETPAATTTAATVPAQSGQQTPPAPPPMPPRPRSVPAPPVTPPPATQDVVDGADEDDAGQWEPERAMATIRKMREDLKAAARVAREVEQLRARIKEADDAKLSDEQRRDQRIKHLEAEVETERATRTERTNRYEVQLAAARLGIVDPDAAVKLLDWTSLDYNADGTPSNLDTALTALLKERPYLAAPSAPTPPPTSPTNGATRPARPGQLTYTRAQLGDYNFYTAHRDDITAAMREGRILDE